MPLYHAAREIVRKRRGDVPFAGDFVPTATIPDEIFFTGDRTVCSRWRRVARRVRAL